MALRRTFAHHARAVHYGILAALLSLLAACAPAESSAPTLTPEPTRTLSLFERYTPQPSIDPIALGIPTLPPTFTPTFTPSPTHTPTATYTPTVTPTPRAEDVCAALIFPSEAVDGLTFAADSGSSFIMQIGYVNASMVWILTDLDNNTDELLSFTADQAVVVNPATLVSPGRYRWTVYVSTPDYPRICERSAEFTVLGDSVDDAPPRVVGEDLIRRLLFGLFPTPTPSVTPTPTP